MMEVWKPVVGYEGLYEVSDHGRVRSLDRLIEVLNRWGAYAPRRYRGRMLRPCENKKRGGYRYVSLKVEGLQVSRRVAVLVAAAFLGPRPAGYDVCHKNGNPADDRAANLRYDTKVGNMADRWVHGTAQFGERHGQARLSVEAVGRIRRLKGSMTTAQIGAQFGVSQQHVSKIHTMGRRVNG